MKKILLSIGIAIVTIAIIVVGVFLIKAKTYKPQNPIATIEIEGYEKPIKIELDPQSAPNEVANFIKLVNNGFYTDYKMNIENGSILGDSKNEMARLSNITENPQNDYIYGIKGDFIRNDFDNFIKHKKGVISMNREDYSYFGYTKEGYNSANSCFAILTEDKAEYDGLYGAFGKVVDGMDVLEQIAKTSEENDNKKDNTENIDESSQTEDATKKQITIKSITVDTFGIDYGMPETVNYEENLEKVNQIYSQYFGNSITNVD